MKALGLIGGMTWHSTADYYRLINQGVWERLGGSHSAEILMRSVDFDPVERQQLEGDWESMGRLMAGAARVLEAAGAEAIVICANTMHRLAGNITAAVRIPLLHIADAAAAEIKKQGLASVGLLGTRLTMEMDFYKGRLAEKHGLKVLVPSEPGRTVVNDVIYRELGHGLVRPEARQAYVEVIADLVRRGAEGVILGCTEIPMLVRPQDSPVPVFDTTALHAAGAVDFALG